VLDTAAFISAIRSASGAAAEILRLASAGKLTLLMDLKLACEYRDVAMRPHHIAASGVSTEDVEAKIELIEATADQVLVLLKHRPLSQDKNDDMVMDVAINGGADAIVTNNIKHFRAAADMFRIDLFTPGEFLAALRKRETRHAGKPCEESDR
jgi:predicted nucleic acid-binding protein